MHHIKKDIDIIPFFWCCIIASDKKMVLIVHDVYAYLLLIVDWSLIMSSQIVDNT